METSTRKLVMSSPSEFRKRLRVEAGGVLRTLDSVMDDWQRRDFENLDPGWMRTAGVELAGGGVAAGDGGESGGGSGGDGDDVVSRGYLERPRGHSKTSDLAVMVAWALFASRRKILGNAIAADKEQARLLRESVKNLTLANAWLAEYLVCERDRVRNPHTLSELTILSSDAGSAYGQTPNFIVCDELTHWGAGGQDCWNAVFSAAAKRADCMLTIISNAGMGMGKSWQWSIREAARLSPDWYFSRLEGPKASWISQRKLTEQRQLLPESAYNRLWMNLWTQNSGDALNPDDIQACCTLAGPQQPEEGTVYVAGLDLAVKHDHAGFVILGAEPGSGRVKLAQVYSWEPVGGQVDLAAVERQVLESAEQYCLAWVGVDPHQAQYMMQRLGQAGVPVAEVWFSGENLRRMAAEILSAFRSRRIDLFSDFLLLQDLGKLSIVERNFGYRLIAVSDQFGHADRGTALSIALPMAMEYANASPADFAGDDEEDDRIDWRVVLD